MSTSHAGFGFANHIYGSTFFMATGFHGFHVIVGTIFLTVMPDPGDARRISRRSSISASRPPPGIGISSTWCGCSCSPASMCGARAATIRPARRGPRTFSGGGRAGPPPFRLRLCAMGNDAEPDSADRLARRSWAGITGRCPGLRSRQAVCWLSHARAALQCLRARLQLRRFRRRPCRLRHPGDRASSWSARR